MLDQSHTFAAIFLQSQHEEKAPNLHQHELRQRKATAWQKYKFSESFYKAYNWKSKDGVLEIKPSIKISLNRRPITCWWLWRMTAVHMNSRKSAVFEEFTRKTLQNNAPFYGKLRPQQVTYFKFAVNLKEGANVHISDILQIINNYYLLCNFKHYLRSDKILWGFVKIFLIILKNWDTKIVNENIEFSILLILNIKF